jgi:hypothetical protein
VKHDLSERLSNKRRQLFWDWQRYRRRVTCFLGWWAAGRRHAVTFWRTTQPAADTLIVFAVPVAAALAVLAALAAAFVGVMLAASIAAAGALAMWAMVIDTAHVPPIMALRATEALRRRFQRKNIFVCPYCHSDLWQTRHHVPGYVCKHGKRHFFVRPSTYGLLSHIADCGCRIGTLHGGANGARQETQVFCPRCADSQHTRAIGIEEFGELPHVSVAVIGSVGDEGPAQFIREAWNGLESSRKSDRARIRVRYADQGSLPEFEDLAGVSLGFEGDTRTQRRRKLGTWVWRVEGSRGKSLLYLHQSDMSWHGADGDDYHQREKAFEAVSGIVLVTRPGEDQAETEDAISAARLVLAGRSAKFKGKLPIPVAVVVAGGEAPFRASANEYVARLVESNFTPVKYFGDGPEQAVGATEWMLSRCKGVEVV